MNASTSNQLALCLSHEICGVAEIFKLEGFDLTKLSRLAAFTTVALAIGASAMTASSDATTGVHNQVVSHFSISIAK